MARVMANDGLLAAGGRRGGLVGLLHSRKARDVAYQALVLAVVAGTAAYLVGNAMAALQARGIATGFGYLSQESGFGIGEGLIAFSPSDTYLRAFAVGLLNTIRVSVLAIIAATVIGVVIGVMRLSPNWGVARLASAYVELFRNTPQLLQVVLWYVAMTHLPSPRQALRPVDGVYISNRGLQIPWPVDHPGWNWALAALLAAFAGAWALGRWAARRQAQTGRRAATLWPTILLIFGAPMLAWWLAGAPTVFTWPALRGLNFVGGLTLSPEFTALFLGLSLYIGAFIAEIVRSGIQSVNRGQAEAARALGLSSAQIYRLVLIPQALRVMIPPVAAQYVSLVKNSSLAVAIGYPDLVNVSNTTINQTGHTIEAIVLMSVVYLVISFTIAALMNLYNRAVALKER